MSDFHTNVADAVLQVLAADSGLQALLGNPPRIYDQKPDMGTFPYLVLGALELRPLALKDNPAMTGVMSFAIYTREKSAVQARALLDALHAALHDAQPLMSGATLIRCQEEFSSVYFDEDSQSGNGRARYRVVIDG